MAINTQTLVLLGFALVFAGIFILLASAFLQSKHSSTGGVIFVGPIPIAFGSFKNAESMKWLWILGTVFFLAYLAWLFVIKK